MQAQAGWNYNVEETHMRVWPTKKEAEMKDGGIMGRYLHTPMMQALSPLYFTVNVPGSVLLC